MPIRSDRCEFCGACPLSSRAAIWENASVVVCGSLFLAVLILVGYAVYQWIERQDQWFSRLPVLA